MSAAQLAIGRVLQVLGIALFLTGILLPLGVLCGLLKRHELIGLLALLAMFVSIPVGWFGRAIAVGRLKRELHGVVQDERHNFLRLRTNLQPRTAFFVIALIVVLGALWLIVWTWIVMK